MYIHMHIIVFYHLAIVIITCVRMLCTYIGKGQLCPQHGSLLFGDLPATDQGQTQWKYYDH